MACLDTRDIELREGRYRLYIKEKFFTMKVLRHWKRFPRQAVGFLSLRVLKARFDGALSYLV